ncbi:hypothetical protein Tco_0608265 [Tanacetum coccineum]
MHPPWMHDEEFKNFTGVIRALIYHTIVGHASPTRFHSVLHSARCSSFVSQSARFSLVATTPYPDLGKDEDNNKEVANPILKRQTVFVDMLKHYWLGIKLLDVDVKIGSSLRVKLTCGKCLGRDRQQLTKLLGIVPNKDDRKRHLISTP